MSASKTHTTAVTYAWTPLDLIHVTVMMDTSLMLLTNALAEV